eukprot:TRINITY_DN13898_c0_g1_i1.p1 TRINITY_DN13898_c0_g1~~TRINITY_DN13898_c0_g1_i1.p1  ORF type:complete len:1070 (+),score=265.58 TRINITY_DN13898_c0_g1_i1:59-3268(+)
MLLYYEIIEDLFQIYQSENNSRIFFSDVAINEERTVGCFSANTGSLYFFEVNTMKLINIFNHPSFHFITQIQFSKNGNFLILSSVNKTQTSIILLNVLNMGSPLLVDIFSVSSLCYHIETSQTSIVCCCVDGTFYHLLINMNLQNIALRQFYQHNKDKPIIQLTVLDVSEVDNNLFLVFSSVDRTFCLYFIDNIQHLSIIGSKENKIPAGHTILYKKKDNVSPLVLTDISIAVSRNKYRLWISNSDGTVETTVKLHTFTNNAQNLFSKDESINNVLFNDMFQNRMPKAVQLGRLVRVNDNMLLSYTPKCVSLVVQDLDTISFFTMLKDFSIQKLIPESSNSVLGIANSKFDTKPIVVRFSIANPADFIHRFYWQNIERCSSSQINCLQDLDIIGLCFVLTAFNVEDYLLLKNCMRVFRKYFDLCKDDPLYSDKYSMINKFEVQFSEVEQIWEMKLALGDYDLDAFEIEMRNIEPIDILTPPPYIFDNNNSSPCMIDVSIKRANTTQPNSSKTKIKANKTNPKSTYSKDGDSNQSQKKSSKSKGLARAPSFVHRTSPSNIQGRTKTSIFDRLMSPSFSDIEISVPEDNQSDITDIEGEFNSTMLDFREISPLMILNKDHKSVTPFELNSLVKTINDLAKSLYRVVEELDVSVICCNKLFLPSLPFLLYECVEVNPTTLFELVSKCLELLKNIRDEDSIVVDESTQKLLICHCLFSPESIWKVTPLLDMDELVATVIQLPLVNSTEIKVLNEVLPLLQRYKIEKWDKPQKLINILLNPQTAIMSIPVALSLYCINYKRSEYFNIFVPLEELTLTHFLKLENNQFNCLLYMMERAVLDNDSRLQNILALLREIDNIVNEKPFNCEIDLESLKILKTRKLYIPIILFHLKREEFDKVYQNEHLTLETLNTVFEYECYDKYGFFFYLLKKNCQKYLQTILFHAEIEKILDYMIDGSFEGKLTTKDLDYIFNAIRLYENLNESVNESCESLHSLTKGSLSIPSFLLTDKFKMSHMEEVRNHFGIKIPKFQKCMICRENLFSENENKPSELTVFDCGHCFHTGCLMFAQQGCPLEK